MNTKEILDFIGYASMAITFLALSGGLYLWIKGVLPPLLRLGHGLSKRKVAILAEGSESASLKDLLLDSGLFLEKNIVLVQAVNDIKRLTSKKATLILMHWPTWKENLDEVVQEKEDACSLIVYAPAGERIPPESMEDINQERNTSVTNFRGRLLGDILVSMMTTSIAKND